MLQHQHGKAQPPRPHRPVGKGKGKESFQAINSTAQLLTDYQARNNQDITLKKTLICNKY